MCNPLPRALHSTVGIRSASKPQMRASGSFRAAVSLLLTRAPRDGVRIEIFERVVSVVCSSVSHTRAEDRQASAAMARSMGQWRLFSLVNVFDAGRG
jgi:hypothetical protein